MQYIFTIISYIHANETVILKVNIQRKYENVKSTIYTNDFEGQCSNKLKQVKNVPKLKQQKSWFLISSGIT